MKLSPETLLSAHHTIPNLEKEKSVINEQLDILLQASVDNPENLPIINNIRLLEMKLSLIGQLDNTNQHPQHNHILQHCIDNFNTCGWWEIGANHWVGCVDTANIAGIAHIAHYRHGEYLFGIERTIDKQGNVWACNGAKTMNALNTFSHIEHVFHTTLEKYRSGQ